VVYSTPIINASWLLYTNSFFLYSLAAEKSTVFFIFIVSISISYNISNYFEFYIDWEKQKQIISLLKNNQNIKDADIILFDDQTLNRNYSHRGYRFYEWNGILTLSFGDDKLFGISLSDFLNYKNGEYDQFFNSQYKAKNHQRKIDSNIKYINIIEIKKDDFLNKILGIINPTYKIIIK
jgi:hypothetical protein